MEKYPVQSSTVDLRSYGKKQRIPSTDPITSASFFALAENAPDIICRFDMDYRHIYANPAIEKVTGVPPSGFIGKTPYELGMPRDFGALWVTQIQHVFDTKKPTIFEFSFPSAEGIRYFQSSVVPEFNEAGNVATVLSVTRNITAIREREKEKDAFLAMITHELKTPVTSVKAFAQLLEKRLARGEEKNGTRYVKKMDTQLNRLTKLIDDLLDATRIGAGKMQFHEKTFGIHILLKEITNDIQKTTSQHTIILKKTTPVKVFADRDRIGQVLLNLLSNAIKYSPDNLSVTVRMNVANGFVTCCVKDQGAGIPKEQQKKLFKRFSRLTKKNHANSPGLGLGLYISSEIIKHEGGAIWVESTQGKGSTFCFTLPVKGK